MTRKKVAVLSLYVIAGLAVGALTTGNGISIGYDRGREDGFRAAWAEHLKWQSDMRSVGFCAWPRRFYESINCAGADPDYPRDRRFTTGPGETSR